MKTTLLIQSDATAEELCAAVEVKEMPLLKNFALLLKSMNN
nr:hypothetical protein [Tanacetum cinerariifolium]